MPRHLSKAEFDALGVSMSSLEGGAVEKACVHRDRQRQWLFGSGEHAGLVCYDDCRGWWTWALFEKEGRNFHCSRYGFGQSSEEAATQGLFAMARRRGAWVLPAAATAMRRAT